MYLMSDGRFVCVWAVWVSMDVCFRKGKLLASIGTKL